MARLTDDPNDPDLTHGVDAEPVQQAQAYLISEEGEFVRPIRYGYTHIRGCGMSTTMSTPLAETYARNPKFYGATYCTGCGMHRPVSEFVWDADGQVVGS